MGADRHVMTLIMTALYWQIVETIWQYYKSMRASMEGITMPTPMLPQVLHTDLISAYEQQGAS